MQSIFSVPGVQLSRDPGLRNFSAGSDPSRDDDKTRRRSMLL